MHKTIIIAAGLICIAGHGAATAQRAARMQGMGGATCGEYVTNSNSPIRRQVYTQWAQGYLSAYNFFSSQPVLREIPSDATIGIYLDKHCRDHPLDHVVDGVDSLLGELGGWRQKK